MISLTINSCFLQHGYIEISVIVKRPFSPCRLKQHRLYQSLHVTIITGRRNSLQFMLVSVQFM